jgi:hypothetical protein
MGCSDGSGGGGGSKNPPPPPPPPTPLPDPKTPTAADFVIENLSQEKGKITAVTITPNFDKSDGEISIYYNGSTILPTESGAYTVTFDIEEATGWNAASGLAAGTLTINDIILDDISFLRYYLLGHKVNDKDTPYYIAIDEYYEEDFATLRTTLNSAEDKYVYLDLSRSTITAIPKLAFSGASISGCNTFVGMTIPNSVTSIEQEAFSRCANLTSVVMPDSLTGIGLQAFYGCASLISIAIPDNVTNIGSSAFYGCASLTSVIIPSNVSIGGQAFRDCDNLISVTFQGTIYSKLFSNNIPFPPNLPYPNDLRSRFYAEDENYGTPGTYIKTGDGTSDPPYTWTRQP